MTESAAATSGYRFQGNDLTDADGVQLLCFRRLAAAESERALLRFTLPDGLTPREW